MKGKKQMPFRASGGAVPKADSGNNNVIAAAKGEQRNAKVVGDVSRLRLDRPGRKLGGKVGADAAPLSTAGRK